MNIESRPRVPKEGTGRYKVYNAVTELNAPIWDTRAIAEVTGLSTKKVTIYRANLRGAGYLPKPTPELTRLTQHTHAATILPLVKEYREIGLSPREIQLAVKQEKEKELSENSVHSAIVHGTKVGNLRRLSKEESDDIRRDIVLTPEEVSANVIAILELRKRLLENNQPLPTNRLEWKIAIMAIKDHALQTAQTAKRFTDYLQTISQELSRYSIAKKTIEYYKHIEAILNATSTSPQQIQDKIEQLELFIRRACRTIATTTPIQIDPDDFLQPSSDSQKKQKRQ